MIANSDECLANVLTIPTQQQYVDSQFPYLIGCDPSTNTAAAIAWIEQQRDELLGLATQHGAVLLRGFPLPSVEDFDAMIVALGVENFPYKKSLSNAVRVNRTERVFSANEAPPEVRIYFHHEMAQTPFYPEYILFYCEIAAQSGGATPVCRSDVLFQRLEQECPEFIADCRSKGLKYSNVMPDQDDEKSGMGRSWRSTLGVDSKSAAEDRMRELGYSWAWLDNDCLRMTTPNLPAIFEVGDGRTTFFNQMIAAYSGWNDERNDVSKAICHGDGTPLDAAAVQKAIELSEELAFDVEWQPGDAVIIDNRVVMHARKPFVGKRKIVASLANMQRNQILGQ